jgi:NADP-dependent 3-hydroxy acid dehydrogenase YdfG
LKATNVDTVDNRQEISPGAVQSEFTEAGGFANEGEDLYVNLGLPCLRGSDVAQAVRFMLMTDYSVNMTEIIIKPNGELF